jgi:hypothetical protein
MEDHFGAVNATVERDISFYNPAEKLYYEPIP